MFPGIPPWFFHVLSPFQHHSQPVAEPSGCSSTRCIQPLLPKPMTAALKRNISLKVLGLGVEILPGEMDVRGRLMIGTTDTLS